MEQTAKILEMRRLGFTHDQIARHLNLDRKDVSELLKGNTSPPPKPDPPARLRQPVTRPMTELARPVKEIKPGLYLLTAEDLNDFLSQWQARPATPDPYEDYVPKEEFQERYHISDSSLQRHQKAGRLKIYRLGNKCYLKKSEIIRALENGGL